MLNPVRIVLATAIVFAMGLLPGYVTGQDEPANAQSASIGGINVGPEGSAFWDAIPMEVAEGSSRGDILWISERPDAPAGSMGWNMVYVSEGIAGQLEYVSGEIYVPSQPADGSRRVALWNHPTNGSQDSCAPSRSNLQKSSREGKVLGSRIISIEELLARGYVVVATDYQGLGTPTASAYLNGEGQAKASLDALKASASFSPAQAGKEYVTYGYSQGGQTSLWIAHIAQEYASEFKLLGAIGIGAASRHVELSYVDLDIPQNSGYFISRMAGLQVGHPELHLKDILTPAGMELLPHLAYGCFNLWVEAQQMDEPFAKPEAIEAGQPWGDLLRENDAFLPIPEQVPLLLIHGDKDMDVPVQITRDLVDDLCKQGNDIEYREIPGLNHRQSADASWDIVHDWVDERFEGKDAVNTCGK